MLLIVYELDGITSQTKRIGFCDGAMNSEAHHFFLKNGSLDFLFLFFNFLFYKLAFRLLFLYHLIFLA